MTDQEQKELHGRIVNGLAVGEDNGVWKSVNAALDYTVNEVELPGALRPDLSAEARAYNNGRVAMLLDFKKFLHGLFQQGREVKPKG